MQGSHGERVPAPLVVGQERPQLRPGRGQVTEPRLGARELDLQAQVQGAELEILVGEVSHRANARLSGTRVVAQSVERARSEALAPAPADEGERLLARAEPVLGFVRRSAQDEIGAERALAERGAGRHLGAQAFQLLVALA